MFLEEIGKMRRAVRSLQFYVKNGVPHCWRISKPKQEENHFAYEIARDEEYERENDRYDYYFSKEA